MGHLWNDFANFASIVILFILLVLSFEEHPCKIIAHAFLMSAIVALVFRAIITHKVARREFIEGRAAELWASSKIDQMLAMHILSVAFGNRFGSPGLWSLERHLRRVRMWQLWWTKNKSHISYDPVLRHWSSSLDVDERHV